MAATGLLSPPGADRADVIRLGREVETLLTAIEEAQGILRAARQIAARGQDIDRYGSWKKSPGVSVQTPAHWLKLALSRWGSLERLYGGNWWREHPGGVELLQDLRSFRDWYDRSTMLYFSRHNRV